MSEKNIDIISKLIDKNKTGAHKITLGENKDVEVLVAPVVNFTTRTSFARSIVALVFVEGVDGKEEYSPEMWEFAKRYFTVKYLTNFVLPETLDEAWLVLMHTDLYDAVYCECRETCDDVYNLARELIMFKREALLRTTGGLGALGRLIDNVIENTKDLTPDTLKGILSTVQELNLPEGATTQNLVDAVIDRQNKIEKK